MTRDRKIVENQGVPEYATYSDLPDPSNFKGLAFVQDTSTLYKSHGLGYTEVVATPNTSGRVDTVVIGDSMTANLFAGTTITAASRVSNVITATVTGTNFAAGCKVSVKNCVPASFNVNNATVLSKSATQITYASIGPDESASDLDALAPMTAYTMAQQRDYFFFWLNGLLKGALRIVNAAGAHGQYTADMLTRFDADVMAFNTAKLVIIRSGYNDFNRGGLTAEQMLTNITTMALKAKNAGKIVVIVDCLPWVTASTDAARLNAVRYNRLINEYCLNNGIRIARISTVTTDFTNALAHYPLANMTVADGIHPSVKSDRLLATLIYNTLSGIIPSIDILASSKQDNFTSDPLSKQLIPNAFWTATGGTVTAPATGTAPSGWTVTRGGSATVAASAPARSDGLGYDLQMEVTATGTSDYGQAVSANITTGFAVGDTLRLSCELSVSNLSGSNLKGVLIYIYNNGGPTQYCYADIPQAALTAELITADYTTTVVSSDWIVPTGVTTLVIYIKTISLASGTAVTVKVGRMSLEKVA